MTTSLKYDEVVDGKTVVTYTIRDEAQYNDGTPIDWKSFEHTWKFNNGENEELNVSSTDGYELIESVEQGENEKQAVVTFKQEYAWWQGLFGFLLPTQVDSAEVYNEGYINELHPEWGAGPYKVDNVDFNTGTVSFVPNENWWGDEPLLDRVTFRRWNRRLPSTPSRLAKLMQPVLLPRTVWHPLKTWMALKSVLRCALPTS